MDEIRRTLDPLTMLQSTLVHGQRNLSRYQACLESHRRAQHNFAAGLEETCPGVHDDHYLGPLSRTIRVVDLSYQTQVIMT